jgi:hypothetical protein
MTYAVGKTGVTGNSCTTCVAGVIGETGATGANCHLSMRIPHSNNCHSNLTVTHLLITSTVPQCITSLKITLLFLIRSLGILFPSEFVGLDPTPILTSAALIIYPLILLTVEELLYYIDILYRGPPTGICNISCN